MKNFFINCYLRILFTVGIVLCGILNLELKGKAASIGKQAPEWVISEWINTTGFTLADMRGKVVVIDFFQLWCPGCNNFSIPLMEKWKQKYRGHKDIQLIGIHTVFEGHSHQTPKRLRQYIKEKNIAYPVGIDDHVSNKRTPETMIRYRTRGTPEMAVIDKGGNIRFQHFGGFNPAVAEKLIDALLAEK
ncbi:MAG: TlpA family protein disulfide reductase [Candidatus Scalinduaceae bacterium]